MGVICYVLLAGYPPFYDEDQKRLFKKIKEGRLAISSIFFGLISISTFYICFPFSEGIVNWFIFY